MKDFRGDTLSWNAKDGVIELVLDRAPCNEIGSATLVELEKFVSALETLQKDCHALIISSPRAEGFCAGADLRELYHRSQALPPAERVAGVREFVERIHRVGNAIDAAPLTTIAAVHGVTFGGGFELALLCDLIVADKMTRLLFSRAAAWIDTELWRDTQAQTRRGEWGCAGSAFDGAQHQRVEGAGDWSCEPGDGRR